MKKLLVIVIFLISSVAAWCSDFNEPLPAPPMPADQPAEATDSVSAKPRLFQGLPEPNWTRTLTSIAIRCGLRIAVVDVLKDNVHEWRPNRHDRHSFPSRHSVWAYGVGTRLSYMLGSRSPWWVFGSQTVANFIGFQRVMDRQHWAGDVLAGAGLGIGLDLVSYGITNAIFGYQNNFPDWKKTDNDNRPTLSVSTGVIFPLRSGWGDYKLGTGLYTNYRFALPTSDDYGVCVDATLSSSPLKGTDHFVSILNAIGLRAGGYWHHCIAQSPVAIGGVCQAGYQGYLTPKHLSVGHSALEINCALNGSLTLTRKLALGVEAGYQATSLKVNGVRHGLSSLTATFYSVVRF
ncbi:MAG: phosphatase PAP2 family protein [Bacteroidales bacterium]|nr:phosphatase PAP2 family protein [Bacteroidales bacterium]